MPAMAGEPAGARKGPLPRRAVIPALLTPYDETLAVDPAEFRRHVASLAAVRGVTGLMVNGASGHDSTLTRDERRRLVGEAVATAGDRVPILAALREGPGIPGIGELARDAAREGARALVVMPVGGKNAPDRAAARGRVEAALAASDLPVALYQTDYDTETLVELAGLPGVFAVKEGSGTPAVFERNLRALRALDRGIAVWSTHSSWLLADLAVGADGILSGMGTVAAAWQVELAEAVWRSDLAAARAAADRLFPLAQVFYRPGQDAHTRMKYALRRLGRQQRDLVRPPRRTLDAAERATIDRALTASGLL